MKVGLVGFAGSGKSTLFHWLTGVRPDPARMQHGQTGVARIPDSRLDWLSHHFKPKKTTPANLEFVDTPGLSTQERKDNPRRLSIIREADGMLIVLNGRSGDPADELRRFREEMLFADLEIITNRLAKLESQFKRPKPSKEREADQKEHDLLAQIAANLEAGRPPTGLDAEQQKAVRSFQLLTLKPEMAFLNIGEEGIGTDIPESLRAIAPTALQAPARLELELMELGEADRAAFMQELGMTGFSRDDILRKIFYGMGRIMFFTIGEDECRAWPLTSGETAHAGAGLIHTDLMEGFVRAEIVPFDEFQRLGSMKEAKAHGVYRLEGKGYVVKDGDIMHILSNK